MDYVIAHTGISMDIYVVLALILLICVIVFFIIRRHSFVKKERELEEMLGRTPGNRQTPGTEEKSM